MQNDAAVRIKKEFKDIMSRYERGDTTIINEDCGYKEIITREDQRGVLGDIYGEKYVVEKVNSRGEKLSQAVFELFNKPGDKTWEVTKSYKNFKTGNYATRKITVENDTPRVLYETPRPEARTAAEPQASFKSKGTYNPQSYPEYAVVTELKELIKDCPEGTIKRGDLTISRQGNSYELTKEKSGRLAGYIVFDMYKKSDGEFTITRVRRMEGEWPEITGIGGVKDEVISQAYRDGEASSLDRNYTGQDPILGKLVSPYKEEPLRVDDEYKNLCDLLEDGVSSKIVSGEKYGESRVYKSTNTKTITLDSGAILEIESEEYSDSKFDNILERIITVVKKDENDNVVSTTRYVFSPTDRKTGEYNIEKQYKGSDGEKSIKIGGNSKEVWEI